MSNYSKVTDFAAKDALSTGNPSKIVKGVEIDDELTAIASAISSKADTASPTFTGEPAAPTASAGTDTTQLATTAFANAAANAVAPTGEIKMWPTSSAPTGFLLCNGTAVSRTIYADLFAVISTTFGSGDGSTTFNLPNFKNRMPIGSGDLYSVAGTGGSKDAVVVSHTHTATVTDAGHSHTFVGGDNTGGSYYTASGARLGLGNVTSPSGYSVQSNTTGVTVSNSTEGVSGTGANLPPYLSVYFIIKT